MDLKSRRPALERRQELADSYATKTPQTRNMLTTILNGRHLDQPLTLTRLVVITLDYSLRLHKFCLSRLNRNMSVQETVCALKR